MDWAAETVEAAREVAEARERLPKVTFGEGVEAIGLGWIQALKIDSHRAEMTLFEAGRAFAAIDGRYEVTLDDLRAVAPMALRQRQTDFAAKYFAAQEEEEQKIKKVIDQPGKKATKKSRGKKASASNDHRQKDEVETKAAVETE